MSKVQPFSFSEPTKEQHLDKAQQNELFATYIASAQKTASGTNTSSPSLSPSQGAFLEWEIIALFYAIVHLARAVVRNTPGVGFDSTGQPVKIRSHKQAGKLLLVALHKKGMDQNNISVIKDHLVQLQLYSEQARYFAVPLTELELEDARQIFQKLQTYLSPLTK